MKRYVTLFSVTAALIISLILGGSYVKSKIAKAEIINLTPTEVENTITCTGKVENSKSRNVYVKELSVAQEIYVQVGDRVEAGDNLLRVLSSSAVSANASSSQASSLPSGIDYSNIKSAQELYQSILNSTASKSTSASSAKASEAKVTDITAPIAGVVSSVNVSENQVIEENSVAITISDSNSLQIRLSVDESQVSDLKAGQKAIITGVGFQNSYSGTVKSISNIAKQVLTTQETVVEVLVSVDDCNNSDIKSGFTAKCKIVTSSNADLLIAPYEAVRANEDGSEYVFIYQNGKTFKKAVKTGKEYENGFEIINGLTSEDKIVINPDSVFDNARVIAVDKGTVNNDV